MINSSRQISRLQIEKGVPMTTRQLALPDCESAKLVLTEPLTRDGIGQLERGFYKLIAKLRLELPTQAPAPGELEFESWTANMYLTNPKPRSNHHA
jgi:hypothetical protein